MDNSNIVDEHIPPSIQYPNGHPMNDIKILENDLFGHLRDDNSLHITKRRKILRHLERKKKRIETLDKFCPDPESQISKVRRPGSLWDVKEVAVRITPTNTLKQTIGPKKQTMYTVKDNKIVRLEPIESHENGKELYKAVNIVMPQNSAEKKLLEGTKMTLEDIKKIEKFKDYNPGVPSKVLYLKNIALSVTSEELSDLFKQFVFQNGAPIDVRLMTGRMRGQAFVAFQNEDTSLLALEAINGTIMKGRPIIVQFGRNSIQDDSK